MEGPKSQSSSVPNSDRLGEQTALCAGKVLLVSEDNTSTFLCELLPQSIDTFWTARLAIVSVDTANYLRSPG